MVVMGGGDGVTTGGGAVQSPPGLGGLKGTLNSSRAKVLSNGIGSRQHLLLKSSKSMDQAITPPKPLFLT